MSFQEILVPFDGSSFSKLAYAHALDIAKVCDSRITVIMIIKKEYLPIGGFSKTQYKLTKTHQKRAEKQIANLEDKAAKLTGTNP